MEYVSLLLSWMLGDFASPKEKSKWLYTISKYLVVSFIKFVLHSLIKMIQFVSPPHRVTTAFSLPYFNSFFSSTLLRDVGCNRLVVE